MTEPKTGKTARTSPPVAVADIPVQLGTDYPAPYDAPCAERARAVLGDLFGLTDFGVNMLTLPPGCWSSQRHWHAREDEFIYVLSGWPTLVTDAGEEDLAPGMCAGFAAGSEDGHHLVNRTGETAVILEVGSRRPDDMVDYPDIDLQRDQVRAMFLRRNGEPA